MVNNSRQVTGWVGWIYFAGFMMLISGIVQAISGLVALLNKGYFLVTEDKLVAFNFATWGWFNLIVGIVVLMAGSAVISGHLWGRVVALILAVLGVIINFAFLAAYPIWSVIAISINVLVIYALTVHGAETDL